MTRKERGFPRSKAKACNAAALIAFMLHLYNRLPALDEQDELIRLTLWGFYQIYETVKHRNRYLSLHERDKLEATRSAALHGYNALSHLSANGGAALFSIIPKFHQVDHILRDAIRTGLNPRVYWTMSDESYGGELAVVARAVHPRSITTRVVQRWLAVFFCEMRDF